MVRANFNKNSDPKGEKIWIECKYKVLIIWFELLSSTNRVWRIIPRIDYNCSTLLERSIGFTTVVQDLVGKTPCIICKLNSDDTILTFLWSYVIQVRKLNLRTKQSRVHNSSFNIKLDFKMRTLLRYSSNQKTLDM